MNVNKKDYGEVFTPIKTVNEMIDKLDEHYKIKKVYLKIKI